MKITEVIADVQIGRSMVGDRGTKYQIGNSYIDIQHTGLTHAPRSQSIIGFVVDEKLRGQGIGKQLLATAMKHHPDLGGQASSLASIHVLYNAGFRNPSNPDATIPELEAMRQEDSSVFMTINDASGAPYAGLSESIIVEGATDVLYHYAPTGDAARIILNGHYSLESSTGIPAEERWRVKGKPWYLATTRSKVGDYTIQKGGVSGALFVLDGRWLGQRYETHPIDYYEGDYRPRKNTPTTGADEDLSNVYGKYSQLEYDIKLLVQQRSKLSPDSRGELEKAITDKRTELNALKARLAPYPDAPASRGSESEDRVYSGSHAIPLRGSTIGVHVFILPESKLPSYSSVEHRGYRAAEIRTIIKGAEHRGIPVYLYNDRSGWLSHNSKYQIPLDSAEANELLKGTGVQARGTRSESDYYGNVKVWVELLDKKAGDELSASADKLAYTIRNYSDSTNSLRTDMHNAARDPSSPDYKYLIKVNDYMRKLKFVELSEITEYLKKKWRNPS